MRGMFHLRRVRPLRFARKSNAFQTRFDPKNIYMGCELENAPHPCFSQTIYLAVLYLYKQFPAMMSDMLHLNESTNGNDSVGND